MLSVLEPIYEIHTVPWCFPCVYLTKSTSFVFLMGFNKVVAHVTESDFLALSQLILLAPSAEPHRYRHHVVATSQLE